MMALLAGKPKRRTTPAVGDRVCVIWGRGSQERELVGYLLPETAPELITIAASPLDDGRVDREEDWWRQTFVARNCFVILLNRKTVHL